MRKKDEGLPLIISKNHFETAPFAWKRQQKLSIKIDRQCGLSAAENSKSRSQTPSSRNLIWFFGSVASRHTAFAFTPFYAVCTKSCEYAFLC